MISKIWSRIVIGAGDVHPAMSAAKCILAATCIYNQCVPTHRQLLLIT